mmetsp:Transcript_5503/g.6277  ORF Transcript_5503/g.6277 Transcript_5503/m.6277 type:complete len:152 (-) Transcript_5503:1194-1649(-)
MDARAHSEIQLVHRAQTAQPSLTDQFKSQQYQLLVFFTCIHMARNHYLLTTARDFFGYLGDDKTGNKYQTIFFALIPLSVVGLPIVNYIMMVHGYGTALQVVDALGLFHGLIQLSSTSINSQVVGFLALSISKAIDLVQRSHAVVDFEVSI